MSKLNPLRKAAILVSSLDTRAADALLDSMPEDLATRVRQAVLDLEQIDPAEQQAIIAEFLRGKSAAADSGGVELDLSLTRRFSTGTGNQQAGSSGVGANGSPSPPQPFQFLHGATSQTLCKLLQREHPQTVALVVAHLPPNRAAEIVSGLPAALQADVLKRVLELEETGPEVLEELEQSLEHLLASEIQAGRRRTIGLAAVGAILDAAPFAARQGMLSHLSRTDADLAARLQSELPEPASKPGEPVVKSPRFGFLWPRAAAAKVTDLPEENFADEVELEPNDEEGDDEGDEEVVAVEHAPAAPEPLPAVEFDDFIRFDNRALALVLKAADPRVSLLALTGARRELVERLLKQLPRLETKELRKRLELSGPVRLRDIEVAQRQLALVASRLAARGEIVLPTSRRFMAAA